MSVKKRRPSASDVLLQEMQQPLVIPEKPALNGNRPDSPEPRPTPSATSTTTTTNMNPPNNNDDAATVAQLKKAQENEAKLQKQIEDLQSKLQAQTTDLKEAKDMAIKLAEQGKAPAKGKSSSTAIVKKGVSNSSITARPTQSHEETMRRRNNTDIGWLD
jgi:hypothetical protein